MIEDKPRLIFVAKRNIEEEEELLFDYGDSSKEAIKEHPWLLFQKEITGYYGTGGKVDDNTYSGTKV